MTSTLKLYGILALLLAALVGIGVIYGKGRLDASHAAELAGLQARITAVTNAKQALEEVQKQDQLQAMQDAEDKDRLNALIDSQAQLLANPNAGCFDADDTQRVREVFAPH